MKTIFTITVAIFLLFGMTAMAQPITQPINSDINIFMCNDDNPINDEKSTARASIGMGYSYSKPMGEFRDKIGDHAHGLNLFFVFGSTNSPFLFGFDGNMHFYDYASRKEIFDIWGYDVAGKTQVNSNYGSGNLVLRFQPTGTGLRPYFSLLGGVNFFWTVVSTTMEDDYYDHDNTISSDHSFNTSFNYGVNGGLLIPVADYGNSALNIDLKAQYIIGKKGTYVVKNGIDINNDYIGFDYSTSNTSNYSFSIGLAYSFN